ncbi:hypothetical protein [uncultured Modestobacter sp.]|uniref:hypothetical protein n=1 Tax=uncultured Modestobacter sp. TaxID=380048 RepID=UPI00262807E4|nr:hypothetical protein [uncultured Modestobacter sp.]
MTSSVHHLVIGSGASSATAISVLAARPGHRVTVLDVGGSLEDERSDARTRMSMLPPDQWQDPDLDLVSARATTTGSGSVPQKRSYGSDYPFRDLGQLRGVQTSGDEVNRDVISSAYGGFTTVWGAQLMPFSPATFEAWPVSWRDIEPHYRAVLAEVPLAGETDDLAETFPLLEPRSGLPPLGPRAQDVLARSARHRAALRRSGVVVGRARLALRADGCIRCGLCMTGCPYSLIYSAAQTMDGLRRLPNVRYLGGLLAERIGQDGDEVVVRARELSTGVLREFRADRLFVGAGAVGTTRLVLGSLPGPSPAVELLESRQYLVPFLSRRGVADPRGPHVRDFTLNQFNLLITFDDRGLDTSQVHCYPHNPAIAEALPRVLGSGAGRWLGDHVLDRLTVGFGYLPSWASPKVRVHVRPAATGGLPEVTLERCEDRTRPPMLRDALRRLVRAAPRLDLWPVLSHVELSGAAKSYHFGGSFPHVPAGAGGTTPGTDRWGRLPAWDRVHLIDGSVLPTIASSTFTMTVMANAHRIASEVLAGERTDVTAVPAADHRRP